MASITEELDTARTYMEIGMGMAADVILDALIVEVETGRIACVADAVRWVRDCRARLEEHCVRD